MLAFTGGVYPDVEAFANFLVIDVPAQLIFRYRTAIGSVDSYDFRSLLASHTGGGSAQDKNASATAQADKPLFGEGATLMENDLEAISALNSLKDPVDGDKKDGNSRKRAAPQTAPSLHFTSPL